MKSSLAELLPMQGMLEASTPSREPKGGHALPNGLTGKAWSKRKSRSKVARQSKEWNRK